MVDRVDIDKILKGECFKIIMRKRGQVTIFIIIAIVLIAAIGLYFVFRDSFNVKEIPSEIDFVYVHIISCLEETTEQGINYISLQGGYYEVPKQLSIEYFSKDIPYYYLNSKVYVPSIEIVEEGLEEYIYINLENCLNFEDFEEQGFEINKGNLLVSTNIKENKVNIKVDYPITITKGESIQLKEFKIEIRSNIEKLLFVSGEIVNSYSETPGFICLTCLEEISKINNVEIKATPLSEISLVEDNIVWFSVSDSEYELNWEFVVKE